MREERPPGTTRGPAQPPPDETENQSAPEDEVEGRGEPDPAGADIEGDAWNTLVQLERFHAGDDQAQTRFFEHYAPKIERCARASSLWGILSRHMQVEDVVQDF